MLFEDRYLKYWVEDEKIKKVFYVSSNGGMLKYMLEGLSNVTTYWWIIMWQKIARAYKKPLLWHMWINVACCYLYIAMLCLCSGCLMCIKCFWKYIWFCFLIRDLWQMKGRDIVYILFKFCKNFFDLVLILFLNTNSFVIAITII